jgi:uncharacterized protein YcbK (DUF882 family)
LGLISVARKAFADMKALVPVVLLAVGLISAAGAATAQTRALKLYNMHTHEKQTIVFKRNGRYDTAGLKKINYFLRDWRKNQETRMDPRLLDLVWEVYQKSGSRDYIHVVCGYRSPGTNAMLKSRSRRSGVAEKSQHILGKAMDFYLPDVPLRKLREIGMKFQVGGVGFYPTSGSPFVHMDVGGVRAWPRMSRSELARLFPDGKTLHMPAEGGKMPGYSAALADYKRRVGKDSIMIAGVPSKNSDSESRQSKSLLAALFSRADEDEADFNDVPDTVAETPKSKPAKEVKTEEVLVAAKEDEKVNAPVPRVRPAYAEEESETLQTALFSTKKNPAEDAMKAALTPQPEVAEEEAQKPEFSDLAAYKIPVPEMLGDRKRPGDSQGEDVLMASAEALDSVASADLGGVPVPEFRPVDAQALVTATVKAETAEADLDMPAPALTSQEIATLARESRKELAADMRTDQDEVASMIDSLDSADKSDDNAPLAEMASLDVPKAAMTRSLVIPSSLSLDDEATDEPKHVSKTGRIKADAAAAKESIRVEPKLTQNLIAKWALTNGRNRIIAKPVKAPRFVSHTMRKQPTEVYTDGFSRDTAEVDPGRFSGSAVTFMPVKKFEN